jgi:hypothetical protein
MLVFFNGLSIRQANLEASLLANQRGMGKIRPRRQDDDIAHPHALQLFIRGESFDQQAWYA